MNKIITHSEFDIMNDKRTHNLYTIEFKYNSEPLIKSFIHTKIIKGATVSSNYKIIKFKATSIQTFKQFQEEETIKNGNKNIKINLVVKLLNNLSIQLKYLLEIHKQCFIGFNTENIIVIDQNKFLYCSNEYLSNVIKDNILLSFPFSQNDFFMSPEQSIIHELPSYVHYKSSYYSLACLLINCLSPEDIIYSEYTNNETNIDIFKEKLESLSIRESKLYWLLKKCLMKESSERNLLFI